MSRERVSEADRYRILFLREQGLTYGQIASSVGRSDSVVRRVCVRFSETESVADRSRSVRQRKTNQSEDKKLLYTARSWPLLTAGQILEEVKDHLNALIILQTVRNRLHEAGLISAARWMMIMFNVPFIAVNTKGFYALILTNQTLYKVPSRKTLMT